MPSAIDDTLHRVFGHGAFRALQREIVEVVVGGGDAFVLMPTGGGKSLCYQLPALVRPGTGIVVSPLLALMKDQVDALVARGVAAAAYNSSLDGAEARRVLARLHEGGLDLLYVAPERLVTAEFLERLASVPLALFAIDEAHCVSQWGHDFRPEYGRLGVLAERFAGVPRIALTATADPHTRRDIVERLALRDARLFVGGFDRPNIRYTVVDKRQPHEQLARFVRERAAAGARSGIVYCLSRRRTEQVAESLLEHRVAAEAYHAGLDAAERRRVQDAFLSGAIDVVCATVAFGMGIDKPDVRFVVHFDLPRSLEAYYQETGRAGRDGLPAEALLLYAPSDAALVHRLITDDADGRDAEPVRIEQAKLRTMTAYAEARTCRRQALLGYFGDPHDGRCDNCDICLDPPEVFDATEPARMALSCVYRVGERFGMRYVIDVLLGRRNQRIRENRHDRLSTYGIGTAHAVETWDAVFRQLIHAGYLEQDLGSYSVLRLTPRARPLLRGEETLVLARPRARSGGRGGRGERGARTGRGSRDGFAGRGARGGFGEHDGSEYDGAEHDAFGASDGSGGRNGFGARGGDGDGIDDRSGGDGSGRRESGRRDSARRDSARGGSGRGGRGGAVADDLSRADAELFERLRELRRRLADERGVPAYVVFADRTLRDMALRRPGGESELLACHGVGPKKLEQYGAAFLAAIGGDDGGGALLDERSADRPLDPEPADP